MTARRPLADDPPWRWQTLATVLIMLHLFAVSVGVVQNAGRAKSLLGSALGRLWPVSLYLDALGMNLAYDFELAGLGLEQGVHELRLTAPHSAEAPRLDARLPVGNEFPPLRRRRWQTLAAQIGMFDQALADVPDLRTELPIAVARQWLRRLGQRPPRCTLTCVSTSSPRLPLAVERAPIPLREATAAAPSTDAVPTVRSEVELVLDPLGGDYLGQRPAPFGEAAPKRAVESGPSTPAAKTEDPTGD